MKTSVIAIIAGVAIASILAGIFGYQKSYESRCLEEGGTMTSFLSCRVVFMDFASDPNAELKQKMQKLIAEEKNNPTRPGHSYVRIAIDSDELTFDEKLQALEIYYTEESTGEPTFDNVITGKDRFEYQEPITFTWKQFGWGFPCPNISIQDELQVDQYNREVLYQKRIVYPCPYYDGNSAFLFTFTEENLPDFPPCTVSGKHVISVKDQFDQWFPLHEYWCDSEESEYEIEYFPISDICDLSCKERLEEQEFNCVQMEPNSYMCREKIIPNNKTQIYTYVIPPELGEYYLLKPGGKVKLSSIIQVSLYQDNFIQVVLENERGSHNIIIEKNSSFTSMCLYDNLRVWTFTDIVEVSGEPYIEMHKRLAKIPDGFDCSNPIHILEKSILENN